MARGKSNDDKPKVKITKESLREALVLFTYVKPYRVKFFWALVFIALSAFTTSLFPLFLGKMIDAASPGAGLAATSPVSSFGFIQDQYGRVIQDRPGNSDTLSLAPT